MMSSLCSMFLFWKAVLKALGEPCEWWNGAAPWYAAMDRGLAGHSNMAVGLLCPDLCLLLMLNVNLILKIRFSVLSRWSGSVAVPLISELLLQ